MENSHGFVPREFCFSILRWRIEGILIDSYYSGELEFFLRSIGDAGRLKKLRSSVRQNAYMLVDLYDVFDISPEMTEEEVRISLQ